MKIDAPSGTAISIVKAMVNSKDRKFESNDDLECLLTFHRDRAEFNYEIVVLHLNHPLMQRALRIFRAQMWKSLNLERNAIKRVTIEKSNIIQKPLVIGWGRNRIWSNRYRAS